MIVPEPSPEHTGRPRGATPLGKPLGKKRIIDAAKEAVPVIDLADLLCGPSQLRRVGKEWVGRCPLPDHEDRSPSFSVNPERNVWHCFGCSRGGDVIELARLAWGYEQREASMAAADLLHEYGHPIPERPPTWYVRQKRQKPIRDAIDRARFEHLRRRLFKRFFLPSINAIEDEGERVAEFAALWEATEPLARMMLEELAERRRGA